MKLPAFDYACPTTLTEAIALLASHAGDAKLLAGGQSLIPMLAFRLAQPTLLIDLRKLPNMRQISFSKDGVALGAMVRWHDIERDARLQTAHPLLLAAVAKIAHYQIRNRGTIGGSIAHSDPAAEMPCVAVSCGAEIAVVGQAGARVIPAIDFFLGPLTTALESDEIIVEIRFPAWPAQRRYAFHEFSRRLGDFAVAAVALFYDLDGSCRVQHAHVGITGVESVPRRLKEVEDLLNGRKIDAATIAAAESAAASAVNPLEDFYASSAYRRALVGTLVERALRSTMA